VRRLGRSTSLRTRVAVAAALAAAIVVAVLAALTSFVLANNDALQLDRRLDAIVDAATYPGQPEDPRHGVITTGRSKVNGEVLFGRGGELPPLPPGTHTVEVNGIDYRVRTTAIEADGGRLVSVGIRADSILLTRSKIPLYVLIGTLSVLVAAGLGWLLAGPAIRPLRRLTEQLRRFEAGSDKIKPVTGAREAEDLSVAMAQMVRRLADAQISMTNSLQTAQDFAASAAHELRTPLTAMRADLDTLRIHDLPIEEREEVVADLSRAQRRVEAIITALGQLASGHLARAEDREPIEVAELLDRVAQENTRPDEPVEISVEAEGAGTVWGWPTGLRLAVDNLVRNAIIHGGASRIVLSASRHGSWMTITVDDDGRGLPVREHQAVLGRFKRGSTAAKAGSGLGLALVAQQATLHGGDVELSDGPLGGLRVTITISTAHEAVPPKSLS